MIRAVGVKPTGTVASTPTVVIMLPRNPGAGRGGTRDGGRVIRAAEAGDVAALREIERAAGEVFRGLGMETIADDEPLPAAVLRSIVVDGRAWVVEGDGEVAAYLIADVVDGCGHVEQVSVHPGHAGHRYGAALVEHLAAWSGARGHPALTLSTFRDVPWNGPYYARCGFRTLADDELGPGLRAIRTDEAARGLDRWPRIAMRRAIPLIPTT